MKPDAMLANAHRDDGAYLPKTSVPRTGANNET